MNLAANPTPLSNPDTLKVLREFRTTTRLYSGPEGRIDMESGPEGTEFYCYKDRVYLGRTLTLDAAIVWLRGFPV